MAESVPLGLLQVSKYDRDGCRVICVSGEVDLTTVHLLSTELDALDEANRFVVLDLRNVTFIDSTGLHAILVARVAARKSARVLVIDPSPAFSRLVTAAGVEAELELLPRESSSKLRRSLVSSAN